MKRKIIFNVLIFLICFTFQACKKDYPKDIPGWMKEKIHENKKEIIAALGNCYNSCIIEIKEYYEPTYGLIYSFRVEVSPANEAFYDFNENYICGTYNCSLNCCGAISGFAPQFTRLIYVDK